MKDETKATFTIRVEPSLRDAFKAACEANHRPASLVLRDLMRTYLASNSQGDLFASVSAKAGRAGASKAKTP